MEMTVLAVADKVDGVSVGDTVLVEKWAGKGILVDGVKCYFVNETELLVVIKTV
jgi:co-chaperonin GroES (HSP10)